MITQVDIAIHNTAQDPVSGDVIPVLDNVSLDPNQWGMLLELVRNKVDEYEKRIGHLSRTSPSSGWYDPVYTAHYNTWVEILVRLDI